MFEPAAVSRQGWYGSGKTTAIAVVTAPAATTAYAAIIRLRGVRSRKLGASAAMSVTVQSLRTLSSAYVLSLVNTDAGMNINQTRRTAPAPCGNANVRRKIASSQSPTTAAANSVRSTGSQASAGVPLTYPAKSRQTSTNGATTSRADTRNRPDPPTGPHFPFTESEAGLETSGGNIASGQKPERIR
ncbi:hypothetical protein [Actinopolymorpha alba]|uniref:hypothetical protein n=1 Tax=Actinopolymorpha alba TaxID=533267 RepID=UPI0003A4AEBE|nr:hypothetical protein [Actinopolymorpha alba]